MDFDWKSLVGAVAPTIATALGGPVAGLAVKALSNAVLGRDDGTQGEIASALKDVTPEQMAAIKKAEQDFVVRMKELDIDVYRIDQKDRESARGMAVTTGDVWTPRALAFIIIGGFFGTVAFVLSNGVGGLSEGQAAFVGTLVGYASAKAEQVVAYYFGSSSGSKQKTVAMAVQMDRR